MSHLLLQGNALRLPLADRSVHCCVTSPPYWGLRDYGVDGQLGLERTPDEYVAGMVAVFREVRRVLRDDGTLWLNIGDSYNAYNGGAGPGSTLSKIQSENRPRLASGFGLRTKRLKPKDLVGIPWMVAFALRDDGWYLRSDCIWSKSNPMRESVNDRPTKSHEYLFLLSKKARYFYDADAVRTAHTMKPQRRPNGRPVDRTPRPGQPKQGWSTAVRDEPGVDGHPAGANKLSVWHVSTRSFKGAHFATFPPLLIDPCIRAGTSERGCCPRCGAPWRRITEKDRVPSRPARESKVFVDPDGSPYEQHHGTIVGNRDPLRHVTEVRTIGWESSCGHLEAREPVPCVVLDPFGGACTTAVVAESLGRSSVSVELKPEYLAMGRDRVANSIAKARLPGRPRRPVRPADLPGQLLMF